MIIKEYQIYYHKIVQIQILKLKLKSKFVSFFDDYLVYYDFEKIINNKEKSKDKSKTVKQHTAIKTLIGLVCRFVMIGDHNDWPKKTKEKTGRVQFSLMR